MTSLQGILSVLLLFVFVTIHAASDEVSDEILYAYMDHLSQQNPKIELHPNKILGAGAHGKVYLGRRRQPNAMASEEQQYEYVAIKILPTLRRKNEFANEFDKELEALDAIKGQPFESVHKIAAFGYVTKSGVQTGCLVLNYIDGATLENIFFKGYQRPKWLLPPDMLENPSLVAWALEQSYRALRSIH